MANGFVFTAGQIPAISGLDDQPDTFEDQVRQTIRNLESVLEAAGSGLEHVVKVNAYLTDPGRLEDYNRVYAEFFGTAKPARTIGLRQPVGRFAGNRLRGRGRRPRFRPRRGRRGPVRGTGVRGALAAGPADRAGEGLAAVSYPTIGHFLEDGFLDPAIRSLLDGVKVAGPAVTVRIADNDAFAMNRALLALYPGAVLVVDMSGDHRHAPVGAVTAAAATAQGAAGVVVDGVATDILELRATGLPVFARGTSCLTTKRRSQRRLRRERPREVRRHRGQSGRLGARGRQRRHRAGPAGWRPMSWRRRSPPMPPNRRCWHGSRPGNRWTRCWRPEGRRGVRVRDAVELNHECSHS